MVRFAGTILTECLLVPLDCPLQPLLEGNFCTEPKFPLCPAHVEATPWLTVRPGRVPEEPVGGVCLFGIAVPEILFAERDGCELGIRADSAEDNALPDTCLACGLDDLDPHDCIVEKEIGRVFLVESNPSHLCCEVDDDILALHGLLTVLPFPEVQIAAAGDGKLLPLHSPLLELLDDGTAGEACTACYQDVFTFPETHFSLNPPSTISPQTSSPRSCPPRRWAQAQTPSCLHPP